MNMISTQIDTGPRAKILARAAENIAEIDRRQFDLADTVGDSPIERILFGALAIEIRTNWRYDLALIVASRGEQEPRATLDSAVPLKIILEWQVLIEGARVDFLVTVIAGQFGSYRSLIIECDGHEFHERTKQQAARDRQRDRKFQDAGHTIYRFTGAEIHADPMRCANQILRWAIDTIYPAPDCECIHA